MAVLLGAEPARVEDIRLIADGEPVELADAGLARVAAARAVVERAVADGASVYGLTTRLGAGRDERVDAGELAAFQRQVVANHRGGRGSELSEREARAVIAARLAVLLGGGAGVRVELVRALAALLDGPPPVLYERGSVGAADLTQLAEVLAALQDGGFELAPGEAAAVLSGNAYSLGVGALAAGALAEVADAADAAVAASLIALAVHRAGGAADAYSAVVAEAGGGAGQARSASGIRSAFAEGSDATVQDPLAFRTAPQVNGALREEIALFAGVLDRYLAARSENPLVDAASGRTWSGGNFDTLALAVRVESLRLLLAHVAAASERRSARVSELLRPFRSEGRTRLPGLALYAAADAVAELRQLAAPVSLGAAPLSGVEDVAAFTPAALRLLKRSIALTLDVLEIERLHAEDALAVL